MRYFKVIPVVQFLSYNRTMTGTCVLFNTEEHHTIGTNIIEIRNKGIEIVVLNMLLVFSDESVTKLSSVTFAFPIH